MRPNRKEKKMEEKELEKIEAATEKLTNDKLDNDTKAYLFELLKRRTMELKSQVSRIENNLNEYQK